MTDNRNNERGNVFNHGGVYHNNNNGGYDLNNHHQGAHPSQNYNRRIPQQQYLYVDEPIMGPPGILSDDLALNASHSDNFDEDGENQPNYDHLDLSFDDVEVFGSASVSHSHNNQGGSISHHGGGATAATVASSAVSVSGVGLMSAAPSLASMSNFNNGSSNNNNHGNFPGSTSMDDSVMKKTKTLDEEFDHDDLGKVGGMGDDGIWKGFGDYILGTLIVRVVAARDLAGVEGHGIGNMLFGGNNRHSGSGGRHSNYSKGSANPYASVRFGNTTQRTSEVYGTVDPVWPRGEAMYMDVTHPTHESMDKPTEEELEVSHPGDPPKKQVAESSKLPSTSSTSSTTSTTSSIAQFVDNRGGGGDNKENEGEILRPAPPVLTVGIFHSQSENGKMLKFPTKGGDKSSGDSDDTFLGMIAVNLGPLLTGKIGSYDEWLPLQGSDSPRATVRIVVEYEASDPPPSKGDIVRFTGFCDPEDLYPANPLSLYTVEESDGDYVLISNTSPEGWVSTYAVHRYMLICEERFQGAMEFYRDELASITERLAHSPMIKVVQDTVNQIPDDGFVVVGAAALQNGVGLLNRWLEGGLDVALGDITAATNWDGRFNPNIEESLSESPHEEDEEAAAQSTSDSNYGRGNNNSAQPQQLSAAAVLSTDEFEEDSDYHRRKLAADPLPNMPCCPITREPMRDPVVAADGHTYERSAIIRWLKSSEKSPMTGAVLGHKNLVPNYMLLSSLQEAAAAGASSARSATPSLSSSSSSTNVSSSLSLKQPPLQNPPSVVVETVTEEDSDVEDSGLRSLD